MPLKRRDFVYQSSALSILVQAGCAPKESDSDVLSEADVDDTNIDNTDVDTVTLDTGADVEDTLWDDFEAPAPPESCVETQRAMEGPYYLEDIPIRDNLDLYNEAAQKIIVYGYICDAACQPIPYAVIEVWHANSAGEYDLDSPEMKYYGQIAADENGFYRFKTILPGAYATGADDYRPKHYHIKIWVNGVERLTTQLYFKDDPFLVYEPNTPESLMLEIDESSPCLTHYDFTLTD